MRPHYHYAPARNWLSDPNGLVHANGEWHLFYQYNPHGEDWGHMAWGHAVSRDLAQWEELAPALLEDEREMVFSGSAVIDHANSAGFGAGAMIAIYTGARVGDAPRQEQCLAYSTDRGRCWSRYAGNPVVDRGLADFRDPNVFWHAPSRRWIMAVVLSAENAALLYASTNLRDWQELSRIDTLGAPGTLWECPLLIELPVEGTGTTRWLFKVDVLDGAPGSGAIYRTGTFDGTRFEADGTAWQVADLGRDFYAAIAWHEPRDAAGRPLWIGWMGNHAYQAKLPDKGWRGAMSLPRRLSLRDADGACHLIQTVEPAAVAGVMPIALQGAPCPIAGRLDLPGGQDWALQIADGAGRAIGAARSGGRITLTRRDPHAPYLDVEQVAEVPAALPLTGWIDNGSFELLGHDGAAAFTVQHLLGEDRRLTFTAAG
ncbi:MAG: glycoside hydrolase family 32 protein [Proteobacteria bacterium]|nr:glycoside hydrolase family 32 protein [Pseudomonadota bacterium]